MYAKKQQSSTSAKSPCNCWWNWHLGSILPSFYEVETTIRFMLNFLAYRGECTAWKVGRNFKFYALAKLKTDLLVKLNSIFLHQILYASPGGLVKLTLALFQSRSSNVFCVGLLLPLRFRSPNDGQVVGFTPQKAHCHNHNIFDCDSHSMKWDLVSGF